MYMYIVKPKQKTATEEFLRKWKIKIQKVLLNIPVIGLLFASYPKSYMHRTMCQDWKTDDYIVWSVWQTLSSSTTVALIATTLIETLKH